MQNAKDSFYLALRARLASIDPERTVLVRGALRPGILVEEAEAPLPQLPADVCRVDICKGCVHTLSPPPWGLCELLASSSWLLAGFFGGSEMLVYTKPRADSFLGRIGGL